MTGLGATLPAWMRGRFARALAFLLGFAALLSLLVLGLASLGRMTRDRVREGGRYTLAFTDIDCPPPPGLERTVFLAEVQYLAGLPDRLGLLDEGLPRRLAAAFALHPWVETVERVEVGGPRRVSVRLTYRTPMLAVTWEDRSRNVPGSIPPAGAVYTRHVDGRGVLLPVPSVADKLPLLRGNLYPPAGPPGTRWGDATVEAAARLASLLRPHQHCLRLEVFEANAGDLVLSTPGGTRVLWGRPPGAERPDEAPAFEKLDRLLDYRARHGDLDSPQGPMEHDVRPRDRARHRPAGKDKRSNP